MNRFRTKHHWLMLLCIAVIALRVTGMHLHLCLDGQEPAQTLHLTDSGVHDDEGHAAGGHADVDLSLPGDGLVKKLSGFDLPVLLAFLVTLVTIVRAPIPLRPGPARIRSTASIRFFQPPLRAPPI
ncbi:MAG TPA: hypothetical protein VNJ47_07230 [Nevskiales bacterium]|nr:hypothetical protein [Nevskiales bacterium]